MMTERRQKQVKILCARLVPTARNTVKSVSTAWSTSCIQV